MSAHDYVTGDEMADLHRSFERELNKLELRVEQSLDAMKAASRHQHHTIVPMPAHQALAEVRTEITELRATVLAMGKVIARHQHAIEDLSL